MVGGPKAGPRAWCCLGARESVLGDGERAPRWGPMGGLLLPQAVCQGWQAVLTCSRTRPPAAPGRRGAGPPPHPRAGRGEGRKRV